MTRPWFVLGINPAKPDRKCEVCGERTTTPGCTPDPALDENYGFHVVQEADL